MHIRKVVLDRCLLLAAIGIFFVLAIPIQAQQPSPQAMPGDPQLQPADPLAPLNAAFRTAYADLRSQILIQTSPIIVHFGDKMALIKDGVRTEAPSVTPRYHALKAVAHVPLALYVMLVSGAGATMDDTRLTTLRQYRELVAKGRDSIAGRGFRPAQRARQLRMFDRSLALIDSTVQSSMVTKADLRRFTKSQRQDILINVYEAAADQIDTMDRHMKAWRAIMTPAERQRLRIVVGSAHMSRVGGLAMQYFSATMGEPYEGRYEEEEIKNSDFRLLLTESVFDPQEMLNVLGTHILDADVGVYFFGDAQRMHRDILADAAEQIMRKKFGKKVSARRFDETVFRKCLMLD